MFQSIRNWKENEVNVCILPYFKTVGFSWHQPMNHVFLGPTSHFLYKKMCLYTVPLSTFKLIQIKLNIASHRHIRPADIWKWVTWKRSFPNLCLPTIWTKDLISPMYAISSINNQFDKKTNFISYEQPKPHFQTTFPISNECWLSEILTNSGLLIFHF